MKKPYPQVAYGAVYFRKSNPPREDWERDYARAAADGMNIFRHWFLWGAIETAPGVFDWADYDRQLELAARYGLGTVIAEFSDSVPEWFFHRHKDCFAVFRDGTQAAFSGLSGSCMTGGFVPGGLCLDNPETMQYVERFLRALAERYKGHPGLFGYDIWNECNYHPDTCYCAHTRRKFRQWLEKKYGSLQALGVAWHRYSYSDWEQVQAPRFEMQCTECMDWLAFRKESYYELLGWKADILRSADPDARITAHGVAATLDYTYANGNNDWLAAARVESYGMTWVMGRKGTEPWKQWQAADLVRAGARGKTFWHAEMQGGPLWLQPQVVGREPEDGRVATAEDIRLWNLVSLAGGARGILYLRWRSLLDGPLFSAFGLYSDDGLPNARSEMNAALAKWANSPRAKALFAAYPQKADIGILVLDQIQDFNRLIQQAGKGKFFSRCLWGAYRLFFDCHIPVDFVHFDDIDQYKTLYFAYPIQINADQAARLREWVERGGTLICEGLPGYFGDRGRVCTVQPGSGIDALFGVRQKTVAFMPDLGDRIRFSAFGAENISGGLFRQSYEVTDAEPIGRAQIIGAYPDGETAVTLTRHGAGTAVLIGTYPSEGYFRESSPAAREMLENLLKRLHITPPLTVSGAHIHARLCEGGGRRFLWLINHDKDSRSAAVTLENAAGSAASIAAGIGEVYWGEHVRMNGGQILAEVPGRDAVVFEVV
ncbi:MAG: beta-galactosidase [Oscillospiraceae bacterium]|nr:beta-galactosidase [Oscillospiraceae bacterium]